MVKIKRVQKGKNSKGNTEHRFCLPLSKKHLGELDWDENTNVSVRRIGNKLIVKEED